MNFSSVTATYNRIVDYIKSINARTRRLVLLIACFVVALSVIIAILINAKPYTVLFTGMTQQETAEISAKLQSMGESYRIEKGDTILVHKDREVALKAMLVSEGYPKSGLTYDVFSNNIGMMSTDFERNQYLIFQLQDRMAACIRLMEGVRDATVTLAAGEQQRYVLQENLVATTASVLLTMKDGARPTADLVNGIQVLVSGGFPGLDRDNVKIIDAGSGREVSESDSGTSQLFVTSLKMQIEEQIASMTESRVMSILSQMYEPGRVRVSAIAAVDMDKKLKEITTYLPADNNRGVIEQETWSSEVARDREAEGGVVGTEVNSEVPIYPGITTDGTEIYYTSSGQIDYLVSQIVEQIHSEASVLTDLRVSVTIDGVTPSAEDTLNLKHLIANTAGIIPEHMESKVALLFYDGSYGLDSKTVVDGGKAVIWDLTLPELILVGSGIFIFLIIIILILVLVGNNQKKLAAEQAALDAPFEDLELAQVTAEGFDINLRDLPNTREKELKDQISAFADENPEISAQLIRTWLRGMEDQ